MIRKSRQASEARERNTINDQSIFLSPFSPVFILRLTFFDWIDFIFFLLIFSILCFTGLLEKYMGMENNNQMTVFVSSKSEEQSVVCVLRGRRLGPSIEC